MHLLQMLLSPALLLLSAAAASIASPGGSSYVRRRSRLQEEIWKPASAATSSAAEAAAAAAEQLSQVTASIHNQNHNKMEWAELANYSIKYQGCHERGDDEGGGSYATFRLCARSVPGCALCTDEGEIEVELTTYLNYMMEYKRQEQCRPCLTCYECTKFEEEAGGEMPRRMLQGDDEEKVKEKAEEDIMVLDELQAMEGEALEEVMWEANGPEELMEDWETYWGGGWEDVDEQEPQKLWGDEDAHEAWDHKEELDDPSSWEDKEEEWSYEAWWNKTCNDIDTSTCYDECQEFGCATQGGYTDATYFLDCQQIHYDPLTGERYYAVPTCESGGPRIEIGIFADDRCTIQAETKSAEEFLKDGDERWYNLLAQTYDTSECVATCAEDDDQRRLQDAMDAGGNQNYNNGNGQGAATTIDTQLNTPTLKEESNAVEDASAFGEASAVMFSNNNAEEPTPRINAVCKNLYYASSLGRPEVFLPGEGEAWLTTTPTMMTIIGWGGGEEEIALPVKWDDEGPPDFPWADSANFTLREREALIGFYRSSKGRSWQANKLWLDEESSVCSWYGVGCNKDGSVIALELNENLVTGNLAYFGGGFLQHLSNLTRLDLNKNAIYGTIPYDLGNHLRKLTHIDFGKNMLRGSIPESLSLLQNLESLMLQDNHLSYFSMMENGYARLRNLDFSNNFLTGATQYDIPKLLQLETVSLRGNRLQKDIPPDFSQLSNLAKLDLGSNRIEGTLPERAFFQNPRLQYLDVSYNYLTGTIYEDILAAAFNQSFVEGWFDGPMMLDLSFNEFEGMVPSFKVDKLNVRVEGNQFKEIDKMVCSNDEWNDGYVALYGCDAIACPVGTSNAKGRQELETEPCEPSCEIAHYVGNVGCKPKADHSEEEDDEKYVHDEEYYCPQECFNGGACVPGHDAGKPACKCPPNYGGEYCEVPQIEMPTRVQAQYELWTTPADINSRDFLLAFGDTADALRGYARFTPRMFIFDGVEMGCTDDDRKEICDDLCTNNGRYCAGDLSENFEGGIRGSDLIKESMRWLCIWELVGWGDDGVGLQWWKYVSYFHDRCIQYDQFSDKGCIESALGYADVDIQKISYCIDVGYGGLDGDMNKLLEEQVYVSKEAGITTVPTFVVNRIQMMNMLNVTNALEAICAVFSSTGTEPPVCRPSESVVPDRPASLPVDEDKFELADSNIVAGYNNIGRGSCRDNSGSMYSYVQSTSTFPNALACAEGECNGFKNSEVYRGFEFSVTERCTCLFDMDGLLELLPLPKSDSESFYALDEGNGEIAGASGTPGIMCYKSVSSLFQDTADLAVPEFAGTNMKQTMPPPTVQPSTDSLAAKEATSPPTAQLSADSLAATSPTPTALPTNPPSTSPSKPPSTPAEDDEDEELQLYKDPNSGYQINHWLQFVFVLAPILFVLVSVW